MGLCLHSKACPCYMYEMLLSVMASMPCHLNIRTELRQFYFPGCLPASFCLGCTVVGMLVCLTLLPFGMMLCGASF